MSSVSTNTREELANPANQFTPDNLDLPTGDDPEIGGEDNAEDARDNAAEVASQAETVRIESEAREAGWVPESDWNGAKEKWKPAKDYLDFRDHVLPTVQRENRELKARLAALEIKDRQREQAIREAEERIERENIKQQLRKAREDGDDAAVDELTDKLIDLRVKPKQQQTTANEMAPETKLAWDSFRTRNEWVEKDKQLGGAFARQLALIIQTKTASGPEEAFTIARDEVRRMYPEKFNQRPRTSMAETGGVNGNATPSGKSWSDLTAAARSAFDDQLDSMNLTGKAREASKARILRDCESDHFRR